ncbi:homoserine O-acetyltransferase/O-succinyltransferase family protein [Nocardia jejuensis]|uniref:homoserine O-acetyltransferase/O-succinyltransferase family protein n=1 Tax=Nocardia jejuensis TaxID=328049 RepID=UPI000AA08372|nr:homoserine O-succinyltransferase [Nocardia jejuensis]
MVVVRVGIVDLISTRPDSMTRRVFLEAVEGAAAHLRTENPGAHPRAESAVPHPLLEDTTAHMLAETSAAQWVTDSVATYLHAETPALDMVTETTAAHMVSEGTAAHLHPESLAVRMVTESSVSQALAGSAEMRSAAEPFPRAPEIRVETTVFGIDPLGPADAVDWPALAAMDALIVSGSEPTATDIADEPCLAIIDRLQRECAATTSILFSCHSAHAALHLCHGLSRHRLARREHGLFAHHSPVTGQEIRQLDLTPPVLTWLEIGTPNLIRLDVSNPEHSRFDVSTLNRPQLDPGDPDLYSHNQSDSDAPVLDLSGPHLPDDVRNFAISTLPDDVRRLTVVLPDLDRPDTSLPAAVENHVASMLMSSAEESTTSQLLSAAASLISGIGGGAMSQLPGADEASYHVSGTDTGQHFNAPFGAADASPLISDMPESVLAPHSRWNAMASADLRTAGVPILLDSDEAGWHLATSPDGLREIYVQGHPEYLCDTMAREYRRDLRRWIADPTRPFPSIPSGYFPEEIHQLLLAHAELVRTHRDPALLDDLIIPEDYSKTADDWSAHSRLLFANWLRAVADRRITQTRTAQRPSLIGA